MNFQNYLSLRVCNFLLFNFKICHQQCNTYISCSLAGVFDICSFHKRWTVFIGVERVLLWGVGGGGRGQGALRLK